MTAQDAVAARRNAAVIHRRRVSVCGPGIWLASRAAADPAAVAAAISPAQAIGGTRVVRSAFRAPSTTAAITRSVPADTAGRKKSSTRPYRIGRAGMKNRTRNHPKALVTVLTPGPAAAVAACRWAANRAEASTAAATAAPGSSRPRCPRLYSNAVS